MLKSGQDGEKCQLTQTKEIADSLEKSIHVVVKRINDGPVYVVKPESDNRPQHTLHRDLLLPCGFLLVEENSKQAQQATKLKKTDFRSRKVTNQQEEHEDDGEFEDEDEESYGFESTQLTTWGQGE